MCFRGRSKSQEEVPRRHYDGPQADWFLVLEVLAFFIALFYVLEL